MIQLFSVCFCQTAISCNQQALIQSCSFELSCINTFQLIFSSYFCKVYDKNVQQICQFLNVPHIPWTNWAELIQLFYVYCYLSSHSTMLPLQPLFSCLICCWWVTKTLYRLKWFPFKVTSLLQNFILCRCWSLIDACHEGSFPTLIRFLIPIKYMYDRPLKLLPHVLPQFQLVPIDLLSSHCFSSHYILSFHCCFSHYLLSSFLPNLLFVSQSNFFLITTHWCHLHAVLSRPRPSSSPSSWFWFNHLLMSSSFVLLFEFW